MGELITNVNIINKLFSKSYLKDNIFDINSEIKEIENSSLKPLIKQLSTKRLLVELEEILSILKDEYDNGRYKKENITIFINYVKYQLLVANEYFDFLKNNNISKYDKIIEDIKSKYEQGGKIDTYTDEQILTLKPIFNSDSPEYIELEKLVNTRISKDDLNRIYENYNYSRLKYFNIGKNNRQKSKIDKLPIKPNINIEQANQISSYILPFIKTEKSSILQRVKYFLYIKELLLTIKNRNNICIRDYQNKQIIGDTDTNKYIILDKQIGTESKYGTVFIAHFYKKLGRFAVKVSSTLINQFREEIKILKKLTDEVITSKCPHFPITYGSIECYMNKDKTSEIVVLNELASGDFKMFMKDYNNNDDIMLNGIAQIILSLLFYYQTTKYFHNDAHRGNFLYHKIKPGGYFHYRLYDKDYYLKNLGVLLVCWDFGLSKPIKNINRKIVSSDIYRVLNLTNEIYEAIKQKKELSDVSESNSSNDKLKKLVEEIKDMKYSKYINDFLINILNTIKREYSSTNISILDPLSIYFIETAFKKIPSFTNNKPTNIINKSPYILNPFILKETTKKQKLKEAIENANKEVITSETNVKNSKSIIEEGKRIIEQKQKEAIENANKETIQSDININKLKNIIEEGKKLIEKQKNKPKPIRPISPELNMMNDISPPIKPKLKPKKIKECPEGKMINPKTGRCIKIKEVKVGQNKRGRPKKIITKETSSEVVIDKEPEKSLKKLLPNMSASFFYNVQPYIDAIKDSNFSSDFKLNKVKEILTDLNDIYDYAYEAMNDAKSTNMKSKYKQFIDYTSDRLTKVKEYNKQILELKFKKK